MTSDASMALGGIWRADLLLVSGLRQALRQPGCPLCRVLRNADLHHLRVILRVGKDDGRMLLAPLASRRVVRALFRASERTESISRSDRG